MALEYPPTDEFLAHYPSDAPVKRGDSTQPLSVVLALEAVYCPADVSVRQDPVARIQFLAQILAAAGSLRPEDEPYLLDAQQAMQSRPVE